MKKLIALGILVTALGAADQAARIFAENKIEERARAEARGAASVNASISSFPFLGRLLLSGSISNVEVRAERTELNGALSGAVEIDLQGVKLERDALLSGSVKLEGIDGGTIALELDTPAIGRVLNLPITVSDGQVNLTVAGRTIAARTTVSNGALLLQVSGFAPFRVPIARTDLINCTAANVTVEGDIIRLSCEVDEVPPALRR